MKYSDDESAKVEGATPETAPTPVVTARRFLFGRPVYSPEELLQMDPFLPPEPEWAAEWERRQAAKRLGKE